MRTPDEKRLSRLWKAHARAAFPPHLRGGEVEGEDMVLLDAHIAGCVSTLLTSPLTPYQRTILTASVAAAQKVLPSVEDRGGAVEYCVRLRDMAVLAAEIDRR
ncbi:hypothetical protein OG897_04490 [Streptomyces sp. NBC_00237]|uniref:hypothetical protein n=1 Tax=Streptomyces sp. NBC_00237 TaxID=2975687 RepID=UPI0022516105|nr:hypothetical protein [Streptomyces sp. NBC_00237]MCX5200724.1 hypothetical protein [Streptomyces sp. NBC_00237]